MRIALLCSDSREGLREYDQPRPTFGTAPAALLRGLAEIAGVEIHVLSCIQRQVESPEKLSDNTWFHSVHVPQIGWLRTGYQGCIRAVRKRLRTINPDVVHAQGTERECAMSGAFSFRPNLLTIHGNMRRLARINRSRPFTFHWLTARLEGFVLPRFTGVVCITNHTRELVRDKARRTWVVPNAVDPLFFEVAPAPAKEPVLVCVGTVCANKNQVRLIQALDPLAASAAFKLAFFGDIAADAYGNEFRHLIGQRSWCHFGGFADRAALREILRTARMLILPSLEDNCPMAVLEAMAAGVPVLAAKVGGLPDLITESETGLFCNPYDGATILAGVRRVLDDPDFGRQLAGRAKSAALARFHPVAVARRHVEIYREVWQAAS